MAGSSAKRKSLVTRFFTFTLPLTAILAFQLFPFVWMILTSLKSEVEISSDPFTYLPRNWTFANYGRIFDVLPFARYFVNSAIVASSTAIIGLAISVFAAYALSRFRFYGRNAIMLSFLTIYMFPPVLLLIPLFVIIRSLGLLDTHFSLVLAYSTFTIPFSVWMMTGFLKSIPHDLEEAAMVDGCGRLGAFVRVTLPVAAPALAATGIYIFIFSWIEFIFAVMFTSSDTSRTLVVGLNTLVGQFTINWGLLTAGGVVTAIPAILLFTLIQRQLIQGLSAGAVKG